MNRIYATIGIALLTLLSGLYAVAGVPADALAELFGSAAGEVIAREMGLSQATRESMALGRSGLSAAEMRKLEGYLDEVRADYLRERPQDEDLFKAGATEAALKSKQEKLLVRTLMSEAQASPEFVRLGEHLQDYRTAARDFVAAAAPQSREAELEKLMAAILSHDTIHPDPHFPESLEVNLGKKEIQDFFDIHAELWRNGLDRKELRGLYEKIRAGEALSAPEEKSLKLIRARLKQLRFAFVAFGDGHEAPEAVDRLATSMGQLQDALKNGRLDIVRKKSDDVLDLLSKKAMGEIDDEIDAFRPAKRSSFRDWVGEQIGELDHGLRRPLVTGKGFHEMRKVISRLVAVYDVFDTINPSREAEQTIEILSTLNGKMGLLHDSLIAGKLNGALDYDEDPMQIPNDIRTLLEEVVKGFSAAVSGGH